MSPFSTIRSVALRAVPVALVAGLAFAAPRLNEPTYESPSTLSRYVLGNGLAAVVLAYAAFIVCRRRDASRRDAALMTFFALFGGTALGLASAAAATHRWVFSYGEQVVDIDAVVFNYTLLTWPVVGLTALAMAYIADILHSRVNPRDLGIVLLRAPRLRRVRLFSRTLSIR